MKTLTLFLYIFSFSYFFAMFFRIILELERDLRHNDQAYQAQDCSTDGAYGYFLLCYNMDSLDSFDDFIVLVYYSFTSLSTVGFGDYNPKSNTERILIAFFLLFGVAIFSYIMGNFITILSTFDEMMAGNEDDTNLGRFFGVLMKFNGGNHINTTVKENIEVFMDYKWQYDKNMAFMSQPSIVEQLDKNEELTDQLYMAQLYRNFISAYSKLFIFQKNSNKHSRYTNFDVEYRAFIMYIVRSLEASHYKQGYFFLHELDEVNEVIFIMEGQYDIGYSMNRKQKYVMRYGKNHIGAYAVTYTCRSLFIYRASKDCTGYFIRKKNWQAIMQNQEFTQITNKFKEILTQDYMHVIKNRIMKFKIEDLRRLSERNDYQQVMSLTFFQGKKDDGEERNDTEEFGQYGNQPVSIEKMIEISQNDMKRTLEARERQFSLKDSVKLNTQKFTKLIGYRSLELSDDGSDEQEDKPQVAIDANDEQKIKGDIYTILQKFDKQYETMLEKRFQSEYRARKAEKEAEMWKKKYNDLLAQQKGGK